MLSQVEAIVRLVRLLKRPLVVMAVKDAAVGPHAGCLDRRPQQLQFIPQLCNFFKYPAIAATLVRKHRSMEFLSTKPRLAPPKKYDRRRSARNQLVSEHPQNARPDQRVDILPADVSRFLFYHPEARIAVGRADVVLLQGTQHVNFASQLS